MIAYPWNEQNSSSRPGPHLLYDGKIFGMQKAGGISRYVTEVIKGLPPDWNPLLVTAKPLDPPRIPAHPSLRKQFPPNYRPHRFQSLLRSLLWRPKVLKGIDLFHPSYYTPSCGFCWQDIRCPVVVTVYDMIYARFPKQMGGGSFIQEQRESILRADHIICISKSTLDDMLTLIPEAAGKSSVIHLACSFDPEAEYLPPRPENADFLFVGARDGYKNFSFLLKALAAARELRPYLRLQVAGEPLTRHELWEIHLLGLDECVIMNPYPDEVELRRLYRNSLALLYPTLYEGFGLPTLEAMACGAIAVSSNTSSLPEVMGDAGFMLDPRSVDDWVSCILQIASDNFDRAAAIRRGYERCRQFSWSKTVDAHLQVYNRLLS